MENKIYNSIKKFNLNLSGYNVLTEAASGNYVCTPIIAAVSGAKKVYAIVKNSKYASKKEAIQQVETLSRKMNVIEQITIIENYSEVNLKEMNIVTNTGFNRPINKYIIDKLNHKRCVIPLMWEPWEYRQNDLDLAYCIKKGIKVYGTNESDARLKTFDYVGFIILYWLLEKKISCFSANILLLGSGAFLESIKKILNNNSYKFTCESIYNSHIEIENYNVIVCCEHKNPKLLIGDQIKSFINVKQIRKKHLIIHIAGNVCINDKKNQLIPENPAKFGYMSFTADFIDSKAVIDLHTAGYKVAEGMLVAKNKGLQGVKYKRFLEENYPALSFADEATW